MKLPPYRKPTLLYLLQRQIFRWCCPNELSVLVYNTMKEGHDAILIDPETRLSWKNIKVLYIAPSIEMYERRL